MPGKTTYVYDGRTPENGKAMLIIEKYDGVPMFMWTGFVNGYSVKLYPRGTYGRYVRDGKKRTPFSMSILDLERI